jgi:hypothetical protein
LARAGNLLLFTDDDQSDDFKNIKLQSYIVEFNSSDYKFFLFFSLDAMI